MTGRWIPLLLLGASSGCLERSPKTDTRSVIAVVAGAPIYADEYAAELHRLELDSPDALPSAATDRAQRRALLDDMIERRLVLHAAEQNNVVVGMDEVDALYQRARSGWKNANDAADCDDCVFESALQATDMTIGEMKLELRKTLMIRKYFRDHVFSRVAVTDDEIANYIAAHSEEQALPEQVRALQIVVNSEEQALMVAREIKSGLSFEDAAMKYSLSPEGKTGGDLGYFSRGEMPAVFDEVCFSARPGTVSKPVASDYGFHLFKVVDERPAGVRPVAELQEVVEAKLRRQKERVAQKEKTEELRAAANIVVKEKALAQIP